MSTQKPVAESLRLQNCRTCGCLVLVSVRRSIPEPVHRECMECGADLQRTDVVEDD